MTDNLDEALQWVLDAKSRQIPLSVGLVGNAAIIHPELVKRNITPDIVTDQTPCSRSDVVCASGRCEGTR